jgi:hypothetical protein
MRRLGEVGAPPPLAASLEQEVEKFLLEEPPSHYIVAMQDIFPSLKSKSTGSPFMGWSID